MNKLLLAVGLVLATPLTGAAQFLGASPTSVAAEAPASTDTTQLDALLHAVPSPALFRADDIVAVQVYGVPDYNLQQTVAEDGSIQLPLIGKIQVSGLSVQGLQTKIAYLLREGGMVQDAQVIVKAVARPSAIVTVSGSVTKPGTFPAEGNLTLMDYLSRAGGFLEPATGATSVTPSSSTVTLVRPSLPAPVNIPLGPDARNAPYGRIPLFPGDELRVSKVGVIYVVGAFKTQGVYPLRQTTPTTVLDAVALGGGVGYEADRGDAHIIRVINGSRSLVPVNVSRILQGKDPDVALQADDILFVPTNQLKAAIKGGGSQFVVSLATAYLYTR